MEKYRRRGDGDGGVEFWSTTLWNQYVWMPLFSLLMPTIANQSRVAEVSLQLMHCFDLCLSSWLLLTAFKSFTDAFIALSWISMEVLCWTNKCDCYTTLFTLTFKFKHHLWFILGSNPLIPFKQMSKVLQNNSLELAIHSRLRNQIF